MVKIDNHGTIGTIIENQTGRPLRSPDDVDPRRIFVVHGRNHRFRTKVTDFLNSLNLRPVVLAEQANRGRSTIEKFEQESETVAFVLVLLTGDDRGKHADHFFSRKRARQNVIFEYGYFLGRLSREKTCALVEAGVEIPSDVTGVGFINIDRGERWKVELVKELRAGDVRI